jgi:hypothetical protein
MINYLYCKLRHSLLSQPLDMFLSDSVDFGQYNAQNGICLANITRLTRTQYNSLLYSLGTTHLMTSQSSLTFEMAAKHKVCMHFTRRLKCSRRK